MLEQHAPLAPTVAPRSLWRHWEFTKLWAGQTISTLGSGVTTSALPLAAVLMLGANTCDMGWLLAAESAPVLLVGMFAGVWVDRFRRRPLLIGADLGRAALLVCIPILAVLGGLRIEFLFAVAAAVGTLTVLFDVAYRSFVPDLLGPEHVLEANSRLASVEAVAEITTPRLTGALIQIISPAATLLLDAASFVGSAVCIGGIRHVESVRPASGRRQSVWSEIGAGVGIVASSRTLRALATWEALRNFFGLFIGALYVLFGLRELGLSPLLIGITVGVGGASNLIGTLMLPYVTRRFGIRPTMVGAVVVSCFSPILIAFAPGRAGLGLRRARRGAGVGRCVPAVRRQRAHAETNHHTSCAPWARERHDAHHRTRGYSFRRVGRRHAGRPGRPAPDAHCGRRRDHAQRAVAGAIGSEWGLPAPPPPPSANQMTG